MEPRDSLPEQFPPAQGGMRQPTIDDMPLEGLWQNFGVFKLEQMPPMGYPQNIRKLFAPIDDIHRAVVLFCRASRVSVSATIGGYDDDEVDQAFCESLQQDNITVQLAVGRSGGCDRESLKRWSADGVGNSVAIAPSLINGRTIVIDGMVTIEDTGDECRFILDPVYAAETRAAIDVIHDGVLKQMARNK